MISMREAYEKIGANYDDACARLMGGEMLARFALKFLDDESMDKLEAAIRRDFHKLMSSQSKIAAKAAGRAVDVSADDFDDDAD